MSDTPETDAEAVDGIDCYGDPLKSWDYKTSKDGEVVPAEFAKRLERQRDEAREELAILKAECAKISEEFGLPPTVRPADGEIKRMINGWKEAIEERDEARRELAETISCIEQAVDFYQVHHRFLEASAIRNLLENINRRRKRNE